MGHPTQSDYSKTCHWLRTTNVAKILEAIDLKVTT